eukprot:21036-Eustigmatos_ZCMA.PRE.1
MDDGGEVRLACMQEAPSAAEVTFHMGPHFFRGERCGAVGVQFASSDSSSCTIGGGDNAGANAGVTYVAQPPTLQEVAEVQNRASAAGEAEAEGPVAIRAQEVVTTWEDIEGG